MKDASLYSVMKAEDSLLVPYSGTPGNLINSGMIVAQGHQFDSGMYFFCICETPHGLIPGKLAYFEGTYCAWYGYAGKEVIYRNVTCLDNTTGTKVWLVKGTLTSATAL